MSDRPATDAYHRWLGIPPEEQPPDHYRLLGLERLEDDPRVIEQRSDERMRLVNGYRRGPHVKVCDQILQHIKVARACLLNPSLKAAYDRTLKPPASADHGDDQDNWFDSEGGFVAAGRSSVDPAETEGRGAAPEANRVRDIAASRSGKPKDRPSERPAPRMADSASHRSADPALATWLPEDAGYELLPPQNGDGLAEDETAISAEAAVPEDSEDPSENDSAPDGRETPRSNKRRAFLLGFVGTTAVIAVGIAFWTGWLPAVPSERLMGESRKSSEPLVPRASAERPVPKPTTRPPDAPRAEVPNAMATSVTAIAPQAGVEIGVAYGTEKRYWLEWAVKEFAASQEGKAVRVNLIPMGSLEGAHAVIDGDKRIHVWTPASSLYRETFVRDWKARRLGDPIAKQEVLALTPMLIVMWKQRYEAFAARAPDFSFKTLAFAMGTPEGWGRIAGRPEWGRFKLGHTHPNQSNSGLMTLVILAYEYTDKDAGLTVSDVMSQNFQDFVGRFAQRVHGFSNSTGNLMKEMVLKGPSSYDALVVYESVAVEFLTSAEGRWEQLQIIYPRHNLWSDNPYYILNTPWSTPEHRNAAEAFLRFLTGEAAQKKALEHGFRPGNPKVPVKGPQSPLARYEKYGLKIDLPEVCQVPSADVLDNLLQSWIRATSPQ